MLQSAGEKLELRLTGEDVWFETTISFPIQDNSIAFSKRRTGAGFSRRLQHIKHRSQQTLTITSRTRRARFFLHVFKITVYDLFRDFSQFG